MNANEVTLMGYPGSTSNRGLILMCVVFMILGVYMITLGLPAIKTGELIHGLSPTYAFGGYEATGGGMLGILVGIVGIWAVLRDKRKN